MTQASGNSKASGKTARRAGAQRQSAASSAPQKRSAERLAERPDRVPREPRPVPTGPKLGWREAIEGTVSGLGFELVEVERAQRGLLRVTIDRIPGRSYAEASEFVLVDDCEQVTRQLQYALEVEGLDYSRLEVSSPGLDRPLKTEADYARFSGQAVKITLKLPFEGRKVWEGLLSSAVAAAGDAAAAPGDGWNLVFKVGKIEQVLGFKFEEVREARLVPVVDFKGRRQDARSPSTDELVPGDGRGQTEPTPAPEAGETEE